ncbi:MAG: RAMP superfamily CRISPR-associated protein [Paludibacter sp.]|nr:RAMP superfamily CRISPR-associated protein [Paludibacter sp.]
MIKIDYQFTTTTPLHTGSDQDAGIMKTLRRQKIAIDQPIIFDTQFTDQARREAIVSILYAIYKSIDWDKIDQNRLRGLWDEMYSKVVKSSGCKNRYEFFNTLCSAWNIRSVYDDSILETLDKLTDAEFFETIRNETHYLVLRLRQRTKQKDNEPSLFEQPKTEMNKYTKTYEMVPCISGNSIRGALRRLVMYDFCKIVGIKKADKDIYHQWFTGGILNDSTQYEDIELRERLLRLNPMLGVFGSAIGKQTIEGMISVGFAYPVCSEIGTGENSYWEYLDTVFQTRLDSSKTEKQIEIEGKHENPDQMKYEYEVFAKGTKFTHGFRMLDFDDLSVSAFWHVIKLFKQNPIVCGMWARGNAEIDLSELPDGDDSLYLNHIAEKAEEIRNEFMG